MWMEHDEIKDAMSAPIAALRKLCSSGDIAVAGHFADLLSLEITSDRQTQLFFPGTVEEVVSSANYPNEPGRIIVREALPAILPQVGSLVLADRKWANALCHLQDGFQRLRSRIRNALIFPVQLKPKKAVWCWSEGCSYLESSEDALWIWTDSEMPEMEAEFRCRDRGLREVFLDYQILWPGTYKGEGKTTMCQPLTTRSPLTIKDSVHRQPVELIDGRAIVRWQTDVSPHTSPNDLRLISFGIKDLQITDAQGNPVLAAPEIYATPSPLQFPPYEETSLRHKLHHAGFAQVGGWIIGAGRPNAGRKMPVSSGAPGFDQVYDNESGKLCIDSLVSEHEIAWIVAQARPPYCTGI